MTIIDRVLNEFRNHGWDIEDIVDIITEGIGGYIAYKDNVCVALDRRGFRNRECFCMTPFSIEAKESIIETWRSLKGCSALSVVAYMYIHQTAYIENDAIFTIEQLDNWLNEFDNTLGIYDFAIGSKVLIANNRHKEFIGLCGSISKAYTLKPEYVQTFGTDKFFRVVFDSPVVINGRTYDSCLFKKTDLRNI